MPNPSSGQFIITLANPLSKPAILDVDDVQGRLVSQEKIQQSQTSIDLSGKAKGMYFMQINYPDNSRQILTALIQ